MSTLRSTPLKAILSSLCEKCSLREVLLSSIVILLTLTLALCSVLASTTCVSVVLTVLVSRCLMCRMRLCLVSDLCVIGWLARVVQLLSVCCIVVLLMTCVVRLVRLVMSVWLVRCVLSVVTGSVGLRKVWVCSCLLIEGSWCIEMSYTMTVPVVSD